MPEFFAAASQPEVQRELHRPDPAALAVQASPAYLGQQETQQGSPLAVTDDVPLTRLLLEAAAAAGTSLAVHGLGSVTRGAWRTASAVYLGSDAVTADLAAVSGLPRRAKVVVIDSSPQPQLQTYQAAVAVGAQRVFTLPSEESELIEDLMSAVQLPSHRGRVVWVVGACGGVGATSFAAALAQRSVATTASCLAEWDPTAPPLAQVLGWDMPRGATWEDLVSVHGQIGAASLAELLPKRHRLSLLGFGRAITHETGGHQQGAARLPSHPEQSMGSLLAQLRETFGQTIVDLPHAVLRDLDPQLLAGHDLIIVSRPTVNGVTAMRTIAQRADAEGARVWLASAYGTHAGWLQAEGERTLGSIPYRRRLDELVALGVGPGATRGGLKNYSDLCWRKLNREDPGGHRAHSQRRR